MYIEKGARIVELHERESRTFPRDELVDSQGQSLLLAETRDLSAIELRDVLAGIELRALGLIGYLPLTSKIILNIRPKFPVKNLWEMLESADNSYEKVFPVIRSYESSNTAPPHQMLARAFCHYLRAILRAGISRGYQQEPYQGYFKPKVNFGRTLTKCVPKGNEVNVQSDAFTFSTNLIANRLLKAACISILRLVPRIHSWDDERRIIMDGLNALHMTTPNHMQPGDHARLSALPIWLQDDYVGALTVYALLIGYSNVGFAYTAFGVKMPSFLFSLDEIFENYVRNKFRKSLGEKKITVLDGNAPRFQKPLFTDNKKFQVKPDLIFQKDNKVIGLAEVKYKPKIDEGDRYQLISHTLAHQCQIGIWVSPAIGSDAGLEYIGATTTSHKFYHYRLNISGDLDVASQTMTNEVLQLFMAN